MNNLVSALLKLAPVLIRPAIDAVESIFGAKAGAAKMEAVLAALTPILEKAAAAGHIPEVPDSNTLQTVVETVFQAQKKSVEAGTSVTSGKTILEIPPGALVTVQFPAAPEKENS